MARNSYVPGEWFGIVRSGTVVVLGPDTGRELVDSLWALLERGPEIHEVLNEVTEGFGVSLTRIPAFGIVDAKDALRVVLRGDLDLETGQGPSAGMHGRDVTTWAERRMELPESYRLRIGTGNGTAAGRTGGAALPLEEGVVLLSGLDAVLLAGGTPAAKAGETAVSPSAVSAAAPSVPVSPISDVPGGGFPTAARAAAADAPAADAPAADAVAAETPAEPTLAPADAPVAVPDGDAGDGDKDAVPAESGTLESGTLASGTAAQEPAGSGETIVALEPEDAREPEEAEQGEVHDDLELTIAPGQLREDAADGANDSDSDSDGTGDGDPAAASSAAGAAGGADPEEVPVDTGSTTDEVVQNLEQTSSYDHLWERTVIRTIEDAAVRVNPDEEHEEAAPQIPPAEATPEEAPAPAGPPPSGNQPEARPQLPPPVIQAPASQAPASQVPPPQTPGLISSVPWLSGNATPVQQAQPPAPQAPVPPQWLPPANPAQANPAAFGDVDEDSDHDGHTIMKSSLANLAQNPAPAASGADQRGGELLPDGTKRPLVLARVCPQGHANPPTYSQCQTCGTGLSGDGIQVPRPSLGRVRLSTGEVIELDRSLIIGRQPSVSRVQGGGMPALVQVESPGGDISRSHVEVRLEGWHVMLCDLKATNGTVLVREGQPPRRLAQNEMAIVLDGDIAELGDNISLRFEEIL